MDLPRLVERARDLRLTTERLVLRRPVETDVEESIAQELDRDVMRWVRDPLTREQSERRVRSTLEPWSGKDGEWLLLTIAPCDDEAQVLGVYAFRVTVAEFETVEIGFRLPQQHRRRGYMTEASEAVFSFLFGEGEVRKITAFCVAENEPSWRLMEHLGMTREGALREHSPLGGVWHDELVYGLLRREWAAR